MNHKKYTFWFHYNVPESKKSGTTKAGVNFAGKYYVVSNVVCNVPVKGMYSAGSRPNWVMGGEIYQEQFRIHNDICYIG
jgi:hypothetical protein